MKNRLIHVLLLLVLCLQSMPVMAREGDTLDPIHLEQPALVTYPDDLLAESDFAAIEGRVMEARNAGAPVAIRIVDMSQDEAEIPFQVRQYASTDFSQPISGERQQAILESWIRNEVIETGDDANDGFLLLVLVPEDRTHTQALWWIGDNALPLNGLTEENILATNAVMTNEFADGNMPNGVFMGISEFSYNVQFGVPERLTRTKLGQALHTAVIPLAIGTIAAGIAVPMLAFWLARKNDFRGAITSQISPWQAAALYLKRPTAVIPAAMLVDAVHAGSITPGKDGSVRLQTEATNPALTAIQPFAREDGIVPAEAMLEVEAITLPVRLALEDELAAIGAYTPRVRTDRTWMLLAMFIAVTVATLAIVPTVVSMSALGVFAITTALAGVMSGWWWLSHRCYTSPAGEDLLASWLETSSREDRHVFDLAVNLDQLTDQVGGPNVNTQTQLVRQLRGLGAG